MAIKKVKLPDNSVQDINDARIADIDDELDGLSVNPVQNSVIDAEFSAVSYLGDVEETVGTIPEEPEPEYTIVIGGGGGDENVIEAITFNGAAVPVNSSTKTAAITANIENFYFVQGSSSAAGSSTSGAYLSTKWEGTIQGVSAATDGLKIAYRIATNTGVSSGGVVLSIDGTNYYPVVIQKNTMVTTHYPVGATVLMVFNSTQTATAYLTAGTKSTVTGCWQIMEYDSNTNTYQRLYVTTGNVEYPITTRYNTTTGETYYAEYGRYSAGVTLNPSTNTITAGAFKTTNGTSSEVLLGNGTTSGLKTVNGESIFGSGNISASGGTGGDTNVIETVKVNGTALTPDANKAVDVTVPTETTVTNWGFTKSAGTITGVKMNGSTVASSGVADLGTVITSETSLSKGTTSGSGNAVTDISVSGHQITLTKGSTFLTSETSLSKGTTSGSGNAVTDISVSGHQITLTKGSTFLTSYTETDPIFSASPAAGITSSNISAWNAKQNAITISSSEPTANQGSNGDIWIVI